MLLPVYPLVQHGGTAETVVPVVARLAEEAARPLVLHGDTAGGTVALSVALLLRDRGRAADLTVLIAPALDLWMQNPELDAVQPHDPWLVRAGQLELTERWIGEHGEDPVLNPFLGDLRGLGPLLLFSGTRDLLNPDTRLFVRRARREGGADRAPRGAGPDPRPSAAADPGGPRGAGEDRPRVAGGGRPGVR